MEQLLLSLIAILQVAVLVIALPTSLVEEIKSSNQKRSDKTLEDGGKSFLADDQYQSSPSTGEWEQQERISPSSYRARDNKGPQVQSTSQKGTYENVFDDKIISDYEKGFRYGSNKDRLDEAIENAVLKSEMYGDSAGAMMSQYRLDNRMKREVDLTPEEVVALLSLYDRRHRLQDNYSRMNYPWMSNNVRDENDDFGFGSDETGINNEEDENWLDNPVLPHASPYNREMGPKYNVLDQVGRPMGPIYEKKDRWGGFDGYRNKRFMVSKRHRVDPTHELKYMNGPNRNDFYTLSQLLSNQREPDAPVVQRLIL